MHAASDEDNEVRGDLVGTPSADGSSVMMPAAQFALLKRQRAAKNKRRKRARHRKLAKQKAIAAGGQGAGGQGAGGAASKADE